jgi:hypothetical protein
MNPQRLLGFQFYREIACVLTLSLSNLHFLALIQINYILPGRLLDQFDEFDEFDESSKNKDSIILPAKQSKMDRSISVLVLNSALILVFYQFLSRD